MGRFRDRMDEELRIRGYSANTRDCYLRRVRHFVRHFMIPPDRLTPEHVRQYQLYLDPRSPRLLDLVQPDGVRLALLLRAGAQEGLGDRAHPLSTDGLEAARDPQPPGGERAAPGHPQSQAPRPAHDHVRRRPARRRGDPPARHGYRWSADDDSRRAGQRAEGPLRHALAPPARRAPAVLASAAPDDAAVPRAPRSAPHARERQSRVPPGPAARQDHQACLSLLAPSCVRHPSAGGWDEYPRDPDPARATAACAPRSATPTWPRPPGRTPRVRSTACRISPACPRSPRSVRAPAVAVHADRPDRVELADIIRAHGAQLTGLSPTQQRVLRALTECRTAALGGHRRECPQCGHQEIAYNSCRDRHCPKCQGLEAARWIEAQRGDLLPVQYFHVVFTVPTELHDLFLAAPRVAYRLLFAAVAETLQQVARRRLGITIAVTAILHTWTQLLLYHPHMHCIVPGGGLDAEHTSWISTRPDFFLPVRVLSAVFRGKLLAMFEHAIARAKIPADTRARGAGPAQASRGQALGRVLQTSLRRPRSGARVSRPLHPSHRHLQRPTWSPSATGT